MAAPARSAGNLRRRGAAAAAAAAASVRGPAAATTDPTVTPHLDLFCGGGAWEPRTASVWALLHATVTAGDVAACHAAVGVVTLLADEVATPPSGA